MSDGSRSGFLWTGVTLMLLLVNCDTHTGPDPNRGVTVYEHPDFGGSSRTFDGNFNDFDDVTGPCRGFFDSSEMPGDWDNCVSSVRVASGWEAIVYEHDDYQGDSLVVTSDIRDLDDVEGPCGDDWDDCISSIRVNRQ